MDTATRLDELMRQRRLTQTTLSRVSGVPQSTINRILQGQSDPALSTLQKLATTLNVSISWLVGETDQPALPKLQQIPEWPFTIDKTRYDALSPVDKTIVGGIVESTIQAIENARTPKRST